jgi:nucleoside-diphosphate-sugar epimerase
MSTQNILILGGSGFLSGTLARVAVAQGHRVWTLTRGQRPLPEGVIGLVADRHHEADVWQAIVEAGTKWDLVVDCIGYTPADVRQDILLLREQARHFVFVSTDFVYAPRQRRFPQAEESDYYLQDGYGGQKRLSELELAEKDTGSMAWTIVRPTHIYGPGSQLGCLPAHGRDTQLITRLRAGESLRLAGGGYFLQQPILAQDLAELILSISGQAACHRQIYNAAGPEVIESRGYYQIIADILGAPLAVEEMPIDRYLAKNPEAASFLCHRFYDLSKLQRDKLAIPRTPMAVGLRQHVESLLK